MRRIFLVLAMLALLVLTAMPATAQSDWWDGGNDHSWWDGGNDHGDDDKDHGDDDKDHWWAPPVYGAVGSLAGGDGTSGAIALGSAGGKPRRNLRSLVGT